ncbi:3325_t:CDS:2, partial [Racocetra fulgida]
EDQWTNVGESTIIQPIQPIQPIRSALDLSSSTWDQCNSLVPQQVHNIMSYTGPTRDLIVEEPEMTQEVQIMPMSDDDTNEEKSSTIPTEKSKNEEQPQYTKDKESPDVDDDNDENKSDDSVEPPPTKRTRTSTRKMNSPVSKRRKSTASNSSNQTPPKRGRGRKPTIRFEDEGRSGQYPKKKTAWKVDEDNYMIDFILDEMPSPAWNRIAKGLQ